MHKTAFYKNLTFYTHWILHFNYKLSLHGNDNVNASLMERDGEYIKIIPAEGEERVNSQDL